MAAFKLNPLTTLILSSYFVSIPVWAEEVTDGTTLPEVTVQAQDLEQTPPSIQTQPSESLLNQGNTETGALLKQINGVDAIRKGGHGLDPVIHGQSASRLNVLLDGAKIQGGCPNRMDPPTSYTEVSSYDQVTVIQGVQSLQYGPGGSGGTLIFKRTPPAYDPDQAIHSKISLLTSSNVMKYDANADVSAVGKQGYVVLQGNKKEANNYKDGNGDTIRSSYRSTQGHIDLGYRPDHNRLFKLSLERSRTEDALYPGAKMDAPKTEGNMVRLGYEQKQVASNINQLKVEAYRTTVDHLMDNYSLRTNTGMKMKTPTSSETKGARIQAQSQWQSTQITYGVQLQSIEKEAIMQTATGQNKAAIWPDVLTSTQSAFAEGLTPLSGQLTLKTGIRYDAIYAKAKRANELFGNSTPKQNYQNTYKSYSGKTQQDEANFNFLIRLNGKLPIQQAQWFAGLSQTYRTADATERFAAKSNWVGNPDLKPEQHNQFDLGIKGTLIQWEYQANLWYDRVNDYILQDNAKNQADLTTSAAQTNEAQIYTNVDVTLYGANASATYFLNEDWDLTGKLSLTKGYNDTDHRNLAMMPPVSGQLNAHYMHAKWEGGARFNFALEQSEVDSKNTQDQKTPAWSTVDLFVAYQVNRTFKISTGVDNLFNHAYYSHLSYDPVDGSNIIHTNEPGQNFWLKVSAQF
ncbi:TonB-dependent receptor domain-containing protein [Galenea microaerophila]